MNKKTTWTLAELAQQLNVELFGDPSLVIYGMATLSNAQEGELSFLANSMYRAQLASTKASVVIVHPDFLDQCPTAALVSETPYLVYAKVSHLFDQRPLVAEGIHPTAWVADSAILGEGCRIGAHAVVEDGVTLGNHIEIGAGSIIGANSVIGDSTRLHARVTLYHGVKIGRHCTLHSGAVIGADGFGFANEKGTWRKIAQVGGVRIGDYVDIGANTTIDRGAIDDTIIGNGVILDNQIQIAHNVVIGEGTAIAGCTGIAGSTTIGKYCTIAGAVGIAGHLKIADRVHLTMRSAITKSITESGSYSSGTAMSPTDEWRKNAARFRHLDEIARKVNRLERRIKELDDND